MLDIGLDRKEGIATDYANLVDTYKQQGAKEQAKQAYGKSIDLFKWLDYPKKVKEVQRLLEAL